MSSVEFGKGGLTPDQRRRVSMAEDAVLARSGDPVDALPWLLRYFRKPQTVVGGLATLQEMIRQDEIQDQRR